MRTVRNQPRTTREEDLVNELKAAGSLGPESPRKQLVTHYAVKDWNPAGKHMYRPSEVNDSEENRVKVLWSDETKIQLFGINSNRHVWRRRNAAYDPKNTIPTVKHGGGNMEQGNNCPASKGRWTLPCTVRARTLKPDRALKMGRGWVFQHGQYQNTQPRQQSSGSRRSTLRSWSGLVSLQTLIPKKIRRELKVRVAKRQPRNLNDLERICKEEWDNIPPEMCAYFTH